MLPSYETWLLCQAQYRSSRFLGTQGFFRNGDLLHYIKNTGSLATSGIDHKENKELDCFAEFAECELMCKNGQSPDCIAEISATEDKPGLVSVAMIPGPISSCWLVIFLCVIFLLPLSASAQANIRLGVLAHQGEERCRLDWQATADYLNTTMPHHEIELIPLSFEAITKAVAQAKVDFLISNPGIYAELEHRYKLEPIATQLERYGDTAYSTFSSTIVARNKDSQIQSLRDLKHKRIMAVAENSFGGWIMAWREFRHQGLQVPRDFSYLSFGQTHDNVILSVKNGMVDAGIVRSGIYEDAIRRGVIGPNELKVLNLQPLDHEYPLQRSTDLYPSWPLSRLSHSSLQVAQEISSALITMPHDHAANISAGIGGWTIARNYQAVYDCLRDLHITPYEIMSPLTLGSLFAEYLGWIIALLILITGLTFALIYARVLNKRLRVTNAVLAESREKYRFLYEQNSILTENLHIGVAIISPEMKLIQANRQMRTWFPNSASGDGAYCYMNFSGGKLDGICRDCPVQRSLKDGQIHQLIREIQDQDNTEYYKLVSIPIKDDSGKITAALEIVEDISGSRKQELELIRAKEEAEDATKAKSEFLANMSHEIRTPLNGVIGFTELLYDTPLSYVQQQYLDNAINCAHSLLSVLNDILDFSKIEAGKLELDPIKTDILELTEQAIDIVKFPAANKDLELILNIDQKTPRYAWVDPIRLKQILVNLLSNAVKFTDHGEVELHLRARIIDPNLTEFSFEVRDTGIGIEPQQLERLFKAFSQADSSTTRKYGGTGLGLVISNLIAEKMQSQIQLQSEPGKGSTFSLNLKTNYLEGNRASYQDLGGKRILFVDDSPKNRLIIREIMTHWGVDIQCVDGALSAFAAVKERPEYDVIIVDYHMPDIDGIDTIRELRHLYLENGSDVPPFILYSSAHDSLSQRELQILGIRYRLVKPVKAKELYLYIRDSLLDSDPEQKNADAISHPRMAETKASAGGKAPVVLIAEDNVLNMVLIKEILKKIHPAITIHGATDGEKLLQEYHKQPADIILMDIQMPNMDGLQACKEIRRHELESEIINPIPVIALTAGVLKEERERCIQAGMNDYLSKPVSQDKLKEILERFVPGFTEQHGGVNHICQKPGSPHFECESLLQKVHHDDELMYQLITMARQQLDQQMALLERAVESHKTHHIRYLAHSIRGTAISMHLPILDEYMKQMELALSQDETNIPQMYELAQNEMDLIKKLWSIYT